VEKNPRNTLTVITGWSGSEVLAGVWDTIYAEDSALRGNALRDARQFLDQMSADWIRSTACRLAISVMCPNRLGARAAAGWSSAPMEMAGDRPSIESTSAAPSGRGIGAHTRERST